MAEQQKEEQHATESIKSEFPTGRVKKIMKLDPDINKVNSEALFLVTHSAELFVRFLAERSAAVAGERKRKTVKLDNLLTAIKRHHPTSDFLLDSLLVPTTQSPDTEWTRSKKTVAEKPLPPGTRRIDSFFREQANEAPNSDQ